MEKSRSSRPKTSLIPRSARHSTLRPQRFCPREHQSRRSTKYYIRAEPGCTFEQPPYRWRGTIMCITHVWGGVRMVQRAIDHKRPQCLEFGGLETNEIVNKLAGTGVTTKDHLWGLGKVISEYLRNRDTTQNTTSVVLSRRKYILYTTQYSNLTK